MDSRGAVHEQIADFNQNTLSSLLPVPFHPSIAKLCIQLGKDMVTASYISPAMRALHEQ